MANSQSHSLRHGLHCKAAKCTGKRREGYGFRSIVLLAADAVCGPSATRLGLAALPTDKLSTVIVADEQRKVNSQHNSAESTNP